MRHRAEGREMTTMKERHTLDEYRAQLEQTSSPHLREKLLAEANQKGFTAWQLAELAGVRAEIWA